MRGRRNRTLRQLVEMLHVGEHLTTHELRRLLHHYEEVTAAAGGNPDYTLMFADAAVRASTIRGYLTSRGLSSQEMALEMVS